MLEFVHIEISSLASLFVILSLLSGGTLASIQRNRAQAEKLANGSLDSHALDEHLSRRD